MGPQFSGSSRVKWFLVSSVGILLVSWIGDYFVSKWDELYDLFTHVITAKAISKAIVDNAIHATIAGWSWLNVWLLQTEEEWSRMKLCQALVCGMLASLLDIDHFLEAGSWHLEDALNLHNRPFLHNTTLILALTAVLFVLVHIISRFKDTTLLYDLPTMFFIACISHHLRDACRRGLWLAPLGSLPSHKAYAVGIATLPVVVVVLQRWSVFAPHNGLETFSRSGRTSAV